MSETRRPPPTTPPGADPARGGPDHRRDAAAGRRLVQSLRAQVARLESRVGELELAAAGDARAARFRLEQFAASTHGWFWEMDADLRFTYFSPSVERVTGLKPEWHYGKTRAEIGIPNAVSEQAWRAHLQALERREPFRDFVFRRAGPDGERWLKTSGDPVYDAEGRFTGYRGTGFDITPEMKARRDVDRLLGAVENLNELFVLWGPDDRLVLCNARFREINAPVAHTLEPGTPFEAHIRAALAARLYPQAAGREEAWFRERLQEHRSPSAPMEVERQDGRWLLLREHRLADGCTVTISTDITARKRTEEALAGEHRVLETALATIPDGVQVLDEDLNLVAWNPRLWEVMELDGEAILAAEDPGKAFRYALARRGEYGPGDVAQLVAQREAIAQTTEPVHYERQLVSGKWMECRGSPIPGGGYVAVYRDIDENRRLQEKLTHLAAFDELTGLRNRRSFMEILQQELERAQRYPRGLSVMLLDVDHFKTVNDRHGHAAGDQVLRGVGRVLADTVRGVDTVARFGGEEFVAVLPECDLAHALVVADRMRDAVAALVVDANDVTIAVTASVGVARLRAGDDAERLLARADQALYAAKEGGRNRVEVARAA